jgi:hypothetical protein
MHHYIRHRSQRLQLGAVSLGVVSLGVVPLGLMLLGSAVSGCNGSEVSLGAGQQPVEAPSDGPCGNGVVEGNVFADTQEEIEGLRGCTEVTGDLTVLPFSGIERTPFLVDLTPLSELRIVRGDLNLGAASASGYSAAGSIPSLAGLESLEQVNNLVLVRVMDEDLSALANLRRVSFDPLGPHTDGGSVSLRACDQLRDLSGLDSLREFADFNLDRNASLTSLSGLRFPPNLRSIGLSEPALTDLSALAPVRNVESVHLGPTTAVENLDGLALQEVELLVLSDNEALQQVDSLSSLVSLETLIVTHNDQLQQLPSLDGVRDVRGAMIVGNAELRSVPSLASGGRGPYSIGAYSAEHVELGLGPPFGVIDLFEVGDNPSLTRIEGIGGAFLEGGTVAIYGNAALTAINFGTLSAISSLQILDNPALDAIQLSQPARIIELEVKNNPNLSVAPFAGTQSLSSQFSGNLDEPAP